MNTLRAWLTRLLLATIRVGALLYARHHLLGENSHPPSRVQRVKLLNPPPPKAKEDKPKEPQKPKEGERPKEPESYQGQISLIEAATTSPDWGAAAVAVR